MALHSGLFAFPSMLTILIKKAPVCVCVIVISIDCVIVLLCLVQ